MKKANGKWRMCVDYRALNTQTVLNRYPLPSIQSILSTRGGSTVSSEIALVSGFHQIRIHNEDIEKTAFNTQFGAFDWVVMPFRLCNAPSTFQRVVNDVLRVEVDLHRLQFMKFVNSSGRVDFTSSLSKGSKLLQPL